MLPNNPNSDYINASFVQVGLINLMIYSEWIIIFSLLLFKGFKRENEYIAAQGPKPETLIDFWRMIWEKEVQLIIMVTSLEENGKVKIQSFCAVAL